MRLPQMATLLRPTSVVDEYGDTVPGPLAPVGEPFPAWLQTTSSTELTADGAVVLVTASRLYTAPLAAPQNDDVLEVNGVRYAAQGDAVAACNPRGRRRFAATDVKAVTHG